MIIKQGNMWEKLGESDYIFFTGNSYITKDGRLVMGRGAAKQCLQLFPKIDIEFGKRIEHLEDYGLVVLDKTPTKIGVFQVKRKFKNVASLDLIFKSTLQLSGLAKTNPDKQFELNYPGIGYGKLEIRDVDPIIRILPDNVRIWTW